MTRFVPKYKYILLAAFFLLLIYVAVPSINYTNCRSQERFRNLVFDGAVTVKYLDKSEHSVPRIRITKAGTSPDEVSFFAEYSGIFDRINVGDSLRKKSGSNEVLVKVNGYYRQLGIADFHCDSAKLKKEKLLFWIYEPFGTAPCDNIGPDR